MDFPHKCNHVSCKNAPPSFHTKSKLVAHLRIYHIDGRKESVLCPEEGCTKTFDSSSSFSQHLSKNHKSSRSTENIIQEDPQLEDAENLHQRKDPAGHGPGTSSDTPANDQLQTHVVHPNIAKFYLMLEAEKLVLASTVQDIFDGVGYMNSLSHAAISEILTKALKDRIPDRDLDSLKLRIKLNDPVSNAHHKDAPGPKLTTNFLRKKYYQKYFRYEEPVEYTIGPDPTLKDHCIAYVSIRRNLENMLKDPTIQKQVDISFLEEIPEGRCPSTVIKNYTNGSIYIKRAKLHGVKRFCIVLFVDAFNPAKSSSREENRYKSVGMYMSLLNLSPASRSNLSSVRLVMLVLNEVLKNNRQECFSYVIDELKNLLTDGIDYRGEKIPVTLEKIAGDNLGQHMIGGFLESFHPNIEYPCRYCEVTNKIYIKKPWVIGELRTRESYNRCVTELQDLKDGLAVRGQLRKDKVYSVKGIKLNSDFNNVPLFHVCDPHLSPCVGHDGFGGSWEYDMAMMIAYFVNDKKWMTYKLLNERTKIFKFSGSDCTNVPAAVKESREKLGGHEVQNWTLIRLFVFFVGDLVETSDPVWQLYLKLKCFVEYVCAPQLTLEQICHMKYLSVEYLRSRYDEDLPIQLNTTVKTHYTAHFADLYELEGPLCQAWTLRFESKHALLGRALEASKTHVNVITTMGKKDQLFSSYLLTQEIFPDGPQDMKKASPVVKSDYPDCFQPVLQRRVFTPNALDVRAVTVDNQEFKRGIYLLLNKEGDTIFVGKIMFIICDGLDTFFLTNKYESIFLQGYGIYEVQSEEPVIFELLHYSSSSDISIQPVYDFNDKQCFSLKHALLEESTMY
ncbi:Zinc finger protein 143 [Frankliniella fusca]|uniref:Zinc finger protein 143 n=1 Tax=Frankliniella fusca TaxID=407009 RepID=A0AAE1GRS5_9NEOP|nr:Zinc finger protein 143 [Frankliniella fusca]